MTCARHAVAPTAFGDLLITADGLDLTGVYFPDHRYPPAASQLGTQVSADSDEVIAETVRQLAEYLTGTRETFELRLRPSGDPFSAEVWRRLQDIPYGARTTYGALARALGNPHLAQRVGQSVGHNPVSIIIPCHRVVGTNGSLTGYAGGLERKRRLLDLEEPAAGLAGRLF